MASALELQLSNYRLTTAEILYRMPDYKGLLQTYVWQDYDLAPQFPELQKFLDFWQRKLEGKLHKVTVASVGLISPAELRYAGAEWRLH